MDGPAVAVEVDRAGGVRADVAAALDLGEELCAVEALVVGAGEKARKEALAQGRRAERLK